jgi:hypothetical protein
MRQCLAVDSDLARGVMRSRARNFAMASITIPINRNALAADHPSTRKLRQFALGGRDWRAILIFTGTGSFFDRLFHCSAPPKHTKPTLVE